MPFPLPLSAWPPGYAPALAPPFFASAAPPGWPGAADPSFCGSFLQPFLLPPRRFKHCASHVYIAHFIDYQKQQQRLAFFQQQQAALFSGAGGVGAREQAQQAPQQVQLHRPPPFGSAPAPVLSAAAQGQAQAHYAAHLQSLALMQQANHGHGYMMAGPMGFPQMGGFPGMQLAMMQQQQFAAATAQMHASAQPQAPQQPKQEGEPASVACPA